MSEMSLAVISKRNRSSRRRRPSLLVTSMYDGHSVCPSVVSVFSPMRGRLASVLYQTTDTRLDCSEWLVVRDLEARCHVRFNRRLRKVFADFIVLDACHNVAHTSTMCSIGLERYVMKSKTTGYLIWSRTVLTSCVRPEYCAVSLYPAYDDRLS